MVWNSNVRGLRGNFDELIQLINISEKRPDIISLCEAFLNDDVLDEVINIDGFLSYRRDRPSSNFGGIIVYIKEGLYFTRRTDLEHKDYEIVWMESISKCPKLHLISVYRPPTDDDSLLAYVGDSRNITFNVVSTTSAILLTHEPQRRPSVVGDSRNITFNV